MLSTVGFTYSVFCTFSPLYRRVSATDKFLRDGGSVGKGRNWVECGKSRSDQRALVEL